MGPPTRLLQSPRLLLESSQACVEGERSEPSTKERMCEGERSEPERMKRPPTSLLQDDDNVNEGSEDDDNDNKVGVPFRPHGLETAYPTLRSR